MPPTATTPRPASLAGAISERRLQRALSRSHSISSLATPTSAHSAGQVLPELLVLSSLDDQLASALQRKDIRLLRTDWLLQQSPGYVLQRRQNLEALELQGASPSPFLSGDEAVALLRRCDRSIGVLSHGWLMPGECDPRGVRMEAMALVLQQNENIEALFWEYALPFSRRNGVPEPAPTTAIAHVALAAAYPATTRSTLPQPSRVLHTHFTVQCVPMPALAALDRCTKSLELPSRRRRSNARSN